MEIEFMGGLFDGLTLHDIPENVKDAKFSETCDGTVLVYRRTETVTKDGSIMFKLQEEAND